MVEQGELMVEFDKSDVHKAIAEAKSDLEVEQAELRKTLANQKADVCSKEIDLEVNKIDHRIAELEFEQAAFDAEIDRKQIELNLQESKLELEKAVEDLANQRRVNEEEVNKHKLKIRQAEAKLAAANETTERLTITAPTPGIAIIRRNWMTRNKFQIEDSAFRGNPVIGLPDLSDMIADVEVSEIDVGKIKVGQITLIKLDAYPDTSFSARVVEIATLARAKKRGSKIKVFDTRVQLDDVDDRLKPGMTVSCEIVVGRQEQAISIPIDAVFRTDGTPSVCVKDGGGFDLIPVTLGQESNDRVLVTDGLGTGT